MTTQQPITIKIESKDISRKGIFFGLRVQITEDLRGRACFTDKEREALSLELTDKYEDELLEAVAAYITARDCMAYGVVGNIEPEFTIAKVGHLKPVWTKYGSTYHDCFVQFLILVS
jgi:hypothetical protein